MEKYIVLFGAGGYDGDDGLCFGNADVVAVKDTYEEAVSAAKEEANIIANEFFPEQPDPERCDTDAVDLEAYQAIRNNCLDFEEEWDDGKLACIHVDHNDDMFPHHATIRISKIVL